jgi:hypothetical protein
VCFHDRQIAGSNYRVIIEESLAIEPIPAVDAMLNGRVSNINDVEQRPLHACDLPA